MNTHKAFRVIVTIALVLGIAGCAAKPKPIALNAEQFADLSVPLDIRELRVAHGSGAEGVFIKLSRLPNGVTHRVDPDSRSIILDIAGPAGPESSDEEALAAEPPLFRVRVSRHPNVLRVALDLDSPEVPAYSVHLLSDWIMVRLAGPGEHFEPDHG